MKNTLRAALQLAVLLGFASTASAVSLSTERTGQVLVYPYYTVNAGQQSTLTLTNHTQATKAVKLMIREGVSGEAAFVLNVYLSSHDTWTGTLGQLDGGPILISNDISCTVPSLDADTLPSLPDGRHYLRPNGTHLSSNAVPDEGYIVAIEMAELTGTSAVFAREHRNDDLEPVPRDCGKLAAAWQSGGYWLGNPNTDTSVPAGGLSGTMTILNSSKGTVFRTDATALKHFRVAAMNTAGDATHPDLSDALSDAGTGVASAEIRLGDKIIQSDYPADRAIDAVTAVLMTQQLTPSVDFRYYLGARTALVVSMPTKRFYATDTDHPIPPFGQDTLLERSAQGTLCPLISIGGYDRDGYDMHVVIPTNPFPHSQLDPDEIPKPCYATTVLALWPDRDTSVLHSLLRTMTHYPKGVGFIDLYLNYYNPYCTNTVCKGHHNLMRPDLQDRQYYGLPVVGFSATGYINTNAGGAGIRRDFTFTSSYPNGRIRVCEQSDNVGGCH